MNKQTNERTETNNGENQKKTKPKPKENPSNKRKNDKITSKIRKQQKEEEDKKLRGYWVNLARKNKNQASKDVLSDAKQRSIIEHDTVQPYSPVQVDSEPNTHVGIHMSKEHSRNTQLADPILESED